MNDDHSVRTSEVFLGLSDLGEGEAIPIGSMTAALGDRGFGLLTLIFALPNIIPMIPGVSTISGVVIALIGAQMALGRRSIWLPDAIGRRALPRQETARMIARGLPWIVRLEQVSRPRAGFLVDGAMRLLIGLMFVALGGVLALPLSWIGNFPPGVALIVLAVGLLERDGFLVAAGHLLGLGAILIVVALVGGLLAGAAWLMA